MEGTIKYPPENGISPKNNREYSKLVVLLDDGRDCAVFADKDDDWLFSFNVGDRVRVDNIRKTGKGVSGEITEIVETAEDRLERVGDLDTLFATEYVKSYIAARNALRQIFGDDVEVPESLTQAAASSVFIQKTRVKDFLNG
jgi:hypothetical protein